MVDDNYNRVPPTSSSMIWRMRESSGLKGFPRRLSFCRAPSFCRQTCWPETCNSWKKCFGMTTSPFLASNEGVPGEKNVFKAPQHLLWTSPKHVPGNARVRGEICICAAALNRGKRRCTPKPNADSCIFSHSLDKYRVSLVVCLCVVDQMLLFAETSGALLFQFKVAPEWANDDTR